MGRNDAQDGTARGAGVAEREPTDGEAERARAPAGVAPEGPAPGPPSAPARSEPQAEYTRPRYHAWADLLRRTFAIDVLACPGCGGGLRFLATIADPRVIAKILRHLGLPVEVPAPTPARQAAWWSSGAASPSPA